VAASGFRGLEFRISGRNPTKRFDFTPTSGQLQDRRAFFLLKFICCKFCGAEFHICRRCYRGQVYCCKLCRMLGYLEKRRQAQQRYRQTEKGKKAHCHSENRRRYRNKSQFEKYMDDSSLTPPPGWVIVFLIWWCCIHGWMPEPHFLPRCRFCGCQGKVVRQFPRQGYG